VKRPQVDAAPGAYPNRGALGQRLRVLPRRVEHGRAREQRSEEANRVVPEEFWEFRCHTDLTGMAPSSQDMETAAVWPPFRQSAFVG
jgi:hypothetical protein